MPLLHATRGADPGIYDARDREVILRAVNYSALGDYYQGSPDFPPVIPPRPGDMADMASLGLNGVRLLVHWSALEPERGDYSETYIARIREQIERAREHGLYVVLDMHQDAWSKFVATPEAGDTCLPPLEPAIGWDGAPEWATITDGMSTCRISQREFSPAVAQAFTNFYLDRNGIQSRFIAAWRKLVEAFAHYEHLAGYDLFNEPHPGYTPGVTGAVILGDFYRRLIAAIRATERDTPGAHEHIVFFEPEIEWSLLGTAITPLPGFTGDTNLVFAPHNYCGSFALPPDPETCFRNARAAADIYQVTFWSGEWGWYGNPEQFADDVRRFGELEDQYLVGGALWQFAQACGDPHSIHRPGGTPPDETIHLKRIGCPGNVDRGFVEANARVLSRPYPRAAPGQLTGIDSDGRAGTLTVTGRTATGGAAHLWVPNSNQDPKVSGEGLGTPDISRVRGGRHIRVPVSGDYRIRVE